MAGGAGWRGKIFAYCPGNRLEVPLVTDRTVDVAVLAHLIDFVNRNIGTLVALRTGMGFSGHFNGESMPGVT